MNDFIHRSLGQGKYVWSMKEGMYKGSPLYIHHISDDGSYVLATRNKDSKTGIFKIDYQELKEHLTEIK